MTQVAHSAGEITAKHSSAAFQFVTDLADEVSKGRVELPAFPDVATRVRKALADERVSPDQIARVVGSEAGLAARVMTLANSVALNRSGKNITELKTAINRIGHNNVRTAAVAFAISQLRRADDLRHISRELEVLWNEATMVAALCHSLASRIPDINADEAMLAGLIHNVGKIYILARAHRYTDLFGNAEAMGFVMRDWQANVGKAIVENWGFAQHIAEAIGEHEDIDRSVGYADLTDVLTVAVLAASYVGQEDADLELNMQGVRGFARLGLDNKKFSQVMSDCVDEINALRSALGT
ncbi:MAG: HDOD domain-containing protein [Steroidobacteraceae bacterium]